MIRKGLKMSKKEFEKILIENQRKNEQSMKKIRDNSKKFNKKVREILYFL